MTVALKPHLSPCPEAVEWLLTQPDAETAWNTCDRADWMLWLAERAGVEKPAFVRIACEIARRVLHLAPKGEDRPRLAIEAAEAWLANPTKENTIASRAAVRAANAAYTAAQAAADAAAWTAAYAAAYAARNAAYWAADAANAAREAAYAARAARGAADTNCVDIVRKHTPFTAIAYLVETET